MDELIVFITLLLTLFLFAWGKIRHDLVALLALFFLVIGGVVDSETAILGFSHPAVITVAAVLIIGKGLEYSGLINLLGKWILKIAKSFLSQILLLSLLVAFASAFMNNVGALALMIPVAMQMAAKSHYPPSRILMPIAFASLLGGMSTLIGTPPNIIISQFRAEESGQPFAMFDYAPVGILLTLAGILFVAFLGWRLLPQRKSRQSGEADYEINDYISEVRVLSDSKVRNKSLRELKNISKADIQILGLVRKDKRIHAPALSETLQEKDIIIIEADAENLKSFVDDTNVKLVGGKKFRKDAEGSDKIAIIEAVVKPGSSMIGYHAASLQMRSRFGVNLLAVSRSTRKIHNRLDRVVFRAGDVLLLQGREHMMEDVIADMGCLPLADRGLRLAYQTKIPLSLGIFAAAIALIMTGLLPVYIAFLIAAVLMVLSGVLPLREMYKSIDWSIIVLLAAMIPLGTGFESSGAAGRISAMLVGLGDQLSAYWILALIMTITMLLSGLINNAATVILMAPVAIGVARGLGFSIDPFLMSVAIGGSAAFLTPVGHQSNTLVMGPGAYRFTDYIRMGLPLTLITIFGGTLLIMLFWPL